jgi:hypothetical protein
MIAAALLPSEPAATSAANAADRSSHSLGTARPVASRRRCPESVSQSHQGPAPTELLRGAVRGPQQELQARIGDDVGGCEFGAHHPIADFGISFQPGETEVDLLTYFFRLLGAEWWSEEDRADEALAGRPEIGAELRDALENVASFLGSAPEKRWVWVLAVEIDHDRKDHGA